MASQARTPASIPGFTAEQTASLHAMVNASVAEAFNRGHAYELKSGLLVARPLNLGPTSADEAYSGEDQQTIPLLQQPILAPVSAQASTTVDSIQEAEAGTGTRKRKPDVGANSMSTNTKRSRRQPNFTRSSANSETSHAEDGNQVLIPSIPSHLQYSNACPKLPVNQPWGHPHLINLKRFDRNTSLGNMHMADVVATILFNHAPQSLDNFLDVDGFPLFLFHRIDRDSDPRPNADAVSSFFIQRQDISVTVGESGLLLPYAYRLRLRSEAFGYIMPTQGAWHSAWHELPNLGKTYIEAYVESKARKFASRIFFDKNWDGENYRVEVTVKEAGESNGRSENSWRAL